MYVQLVILSGIQIIIKLHNLNVDNLTRNEYSRLLMTKSFYDNIPTETFLIFQI